MCIFLGCRYAQELRDRKRFLLLLHTWRVRSSLQELHESMIPRAIHHRAHSGEAVVDSFDRAAVLVCWFPLDRPPDLEPMRAFLLLDSVHGRFDRLVRSCASASKVDFVGTDYMLVSPALPHGSAAVESGGAGEQAGREGALVRLAARMRAMWK